MKREWCVHYAGLYNKTECDAGVRYADVTVPGEGMLLKRLPCFQDGAGDCASRRWPTEQELADFDKEVGESLQRMFKAREAIWEYITLHEAETRFVKATVICPICNGPLTFAYSGHYNGHIHAHCETPGCVDWME